MRLALGASRSPARPTAADRKRAVVAHRRRGRRRPRLGPPRSRRRHRRRARCRSPSYSRDRSAGPAFLAAALLRDRHPVRRRRWRRRVRVGAGPERLGLRRFDLQEIPGGRRGRPVTAAADRRRLVCAACRRRADPGRRRRQAGLGRHSASTCCATPACRGASSIGRWSSRRDGPGVESATVARIPLLGGTGRVLGVEGRGSTHEFAQSEGGRVVSRNPDPINANVVGPKFFKTTVISLVKGRDFRNGRGNRVASGHIERDRRGDAVRGRQSNRRPGSERWAGRSVAGIVGVARDSKYGSLAEEPCCLPLRAKSRNRHGPVHPAPRSRRPHSSAAFAGDPAAQCRPPVPNIRTMNDTIGTSLYAARMGAWLLAVFGGLALRWRSWASTACCRSRCHGAPGGDGHTTGARCGHAPRLLVVRDGMLLVGVGILLGLAAGLAAARVIASSFPGVSATDLPTFARPIGLLGTVALVACAIPARRAIRINPIAALRHD